MTHNASRPTKVRAAPARSARTHWRWMRLSIVALGIALPYLARIGMDAQYAHASADAQLYVLATGALLWLPLLALSWVFRFVHALLPAALLGLGFAFWAHVSVTLATPADAAHAALQIPLLALVPAAIGACMGWGLEARARARARRLAQTHRE